jgi:hypothetical protein
MLQCPHCSAALTRADLASRRLLRPRRCAACSGEYIEGGTGVAMAIVGAGGAVATRIGSLLNVPTWAPPAIAFGCALIGVLYTQSQPPRPAGALRSTLLQALAVGPLAALVVWQLMNLFAAR